ncbi:MAG: ribbon-helix-helix domain-containing protein [Patescibacteria group bacterium]|nr:ribbon-helix-helix domain-containing protein [Patescibacteria group bacterium]
MTTITISLPDQTANQIDKSVKLGNFASRSEFIRNLIRRYFFPEVRFESFTPQPLAEIKKDLSLSGKYNQKFITSVIKGLEKSSAYENKTAKS